MAFNFKRPGNLGGPEATRFLPEDEDTMASLDLYIETLEEDKQKEKTWLPPASPFHQSDGTCDIYSGLDDGCTAENFSRLQKTASYKADKDSVKSYGDEGGACLRSTEDISATRSSSCQPRAFAALLAPDTEKGKGKASLQVASSPATSQQSQLSAGKTSSRTSESEPDVVLAPTNKDYTDLLDKYRILRGNMLSLLRTAQKELQLKVDTIAELRKTVESHGDKSGRRDVATTDVAHSFVQTEPFPHTLATSKAPQTSACDKQDGKKPQITKTDASVLSETPAQTDAIVISDRHQQTDIVCFKSLSIQTTSCVLTSSGMQTEPVKVQAGSAVPDLSTLQVRSSAELYRSKAFSKRSVKYSRSVSLDSSVELCKPKVSSLGHSDQAATSGHRRESSFQRLQSVTYEDTVTELVRDDRNQNMECESSDTDQGAVTLSSSSVDKELPSDTHLPEKHSERGLTNSTGIHIDEESLLLMDKDFAESNKSDGIGQQETVSQKTDDTLEKADAPMLPVKENIHKLQCPQEKAHSNRTRRPSSSPEHVASLAHSDNQTAAEGDAWKRNLFLWVDYSHRRVSRRKEIDAFYSGGQSPKVYDWEGERDVSRGLEDEVAEKTDVPDGCQGESQSGVSPPHADEDHVQDEDTPQGQCVKSAKNGALSNQSKRKRKKAKKDKRRSGEDGERSDEKKKGKKKRRESVVDDAMKCMDECQEQRKLGVDESLKSLQEMSACTSEETDDKANHTMTLNQPDLRPLCSEQSTTNSQMCEIPSDSAMAISSQNPLFSSDAELDINPGESRVHEEKECAAKPGEICTVESDISIDTDDTKADNISLPKRRLLFNHPAMQPVLNSITEGVESMPSDGERSESETEDVIEDSFPLAQSPSHCSVVDSNKGRQNIESSEMPLRQPQASPDLGQRKCHGSENLGSNGSPFIAIDETESIIKRKSVVDPFEESTEQDSGSEIGAFSSGVFGPVTCDDDDDFDTSKLDKFSGGTSCLEVTPVKERPTKSSIVTTPKVMSMLDGTPERKSCTRTALLSSPSLIWSPDKTCSNIVGLREPLSRHAFHTLAGFSITAGSEDTNMSNASFASGLQHKMPSTDIDPTPLASCTDGEEIPQSVAEENISVASRTRTAVEPTLSVHMDQEESELTVTTLRKVSSRGEERVDVEGYHYQSDMNTPLFGYPSLTSVHKGSCFQYKRTPRFLASSSSSSTLVTSATSASCSATSVVSSSSTTSSTVLEVHRAGHVEGPNSTVTSTSMENVQHTGPEVQNKTVSYSSKDGSAGLSSSSSPLKLVPRAAFDSDQCQTTEDLDDSQEGLTQPAVREATSILYPENNSSISRANRSASALKDKNSHLHTPQFSEKLKDGLRVQTVPTTNSNTNGESVSVYPVQGVEDTAKDNNTLFQRASNTDNLEGSKRGTSNGIAIAEDSLEEGEVRTNDGFSSTADLEKPDLALDSLAEVPECTDNDNAQFTELWEMLQHKEHCPSVEKPTFTSGSSDRIELWQKGSQPLAADLAVDIEGVCLKGDARKKKWDKKKESKGVKLSNTSKNTKDLTKEEKEEEDLKRQIRARQDELRCLIISQQDAGQGLPLKNNPDAVLKTYKIPKVGKKGKEGEKTSATQGHTQKSEYRKPTCRSRAKSKYSQEPSTSMGNILCDVIVNRRNAEGESHADKTCSLTQFSALSEKHQQRRDIQSQDVETASEGPQNAPDNIEGVTRIGSAGAEDCQDIDIEDAGSEVLETELDGSGRTRFFNYFRDPFKLRPQVKDFEEDIDDEYDSDQSGTGKTEERDKDEDRNFDQGDSEAGHGECQDGAPENTKGEMMEKGCQDERQQLPGAEEDNEMSCGSDGKGLSSEGECDSSDVNSDHEADTIDSCTTSHPRVRSDETYVVHKNKKQTDQLSLGEISHSDDSDIEQVHVVESEIAQLSQRNLSKHCSSTIDHAGNLAETLSADCLSLDAFGAGEGHFLSENTDMSAREQTHIPECHKHMTKSDQSKKTIENKTRHNSQKSSRATVTSTVTHKSMLGREMAKDVLVSKTSEQCVGEKSSTSYHTGCSSHKDRQWKQHERKSLHAEKGAPKNKRSRSRSRSNSGSRGIDLRSKLDHAHSAQKRRRSPSCSSTKENGRSSPRRQRSERHGNSCDDRKANGRNLSPHNNRGKPYFRSKGRERSRSASPSTPHRCCKKISPSSRKRSPVHRSNNSQVLTTRHRRISTLSSSNSHSRSRSRERFDSRRKRHHSSRSRSQSPARHRDRCSSHTAKHKRSRTRSREREGRHTCHTDTHRDHGRDYSTHTTERSRKERGRSPSPNRPHDCLCDKCSASHSRSGVYSCSGQKTRSHSPLQGYHERHSPLQGYHERHECHNRRGDVHSQDKGHYDRPKERKRRC